MATSLPLLLPVTGLRLIHPKTGCSFRSDFPGSGGVSAVATPSYRFREGHHVSGLCETLLEKYDEVHPGIVDSIPHPFIIVGIINGKVHRAVPDRYRLFVDGSRALAECKDCLAGFYRPGALVQQALTIAAADFLECAYQPIVPGSLGTKLHRANVERIYGARTVHVPERVKALAVRLLADGPMTLGSFTAAIHEREINGFAMTCAMMVARIVEIEIPSDHKLCASDLVRLMPPVPFGLPSIRR